jgi:hypothetical protein
MHYQHNSETVKVPKQAANVLALDVYSGKHARCMWWFRISSRPVQLYIVAPFWNPSAIITKALTHHDQRI